MTDGVEPKALQDPDPAARARAIAQLRYRDLKDPLLLRLALRACRDPSVIDAAAPSGDPFAAFFGSAQGAGRAVADQAAERLGKTGLPPDRASVEAIAEVLAEEGPAGRLPELVARALGETRWEDPDHALRTLIPALDRFDAPLFQAIVQLPSTATPTLIALAVHPYRARLFQELMNHPPSKDALVEAAVAAFVDADGATLASVTTVLAAWSDPAAARIAAANQDRFPWLVAVRAIDDPEARPALAAWLSGSPEVPEGWWGRVAELLRHRDVVTDFPTAAWIRAAGDDHGLCAAWGIAQPGVAEVLAERVRSDGDWSAILLLVEGNAHRPVLDAIDPTAAPWVRAALSALAAADPPIPGLLDALLDHLRRDPSDVATAADALAALGAGAAASEIVLDAAERTPERAAPAGRGLVRVDREGVDLEGLESLVPPALADRFEAVRPFVRAAE